MRRAPSRSARFPALALAALAACGRAPEGLKRSEGPVSSAAGSSGGAYAASAAAADHATLRARAEIGFARADFLKPAMEDDLVDPYLAPIFYVETAGGVEDEGGGLAIGTVVRGADGRPSVDLARPAVYVARERVSVAAREREQVLFAWFRAGPDGAPRAHGLRTTLDVDGRPKVHEVLGAGSAARRIFVSEAFERRAEEAFGAPLEGRAFSAEAALESAPDALVAGLFRQGSTPLGPFLYVGRDAPDVLALHCRCEPSRVGEVGPTREYALLPLESALAAGAEPPAWPDAVGLERALRVPPH